MTRVKIAVVAAHFHEGSTTEYVMSACRRLGYEVERLAPPVFYSSVPQNEYHHYFCVDSGEPLDLRCIAADASLERVSFWCIDFRHNKNRTTRIPNDLETARLLSSRGGTLFQAQREDWEECNALMIPRVFWLPLAADPSIWSHLGETKRYHLGFVGNVWDAGRAEVLELLLRTPGLRFGFAGNGRVWKEKAAHIIRSCVAGFNVNSWFGQGYDYDVNMRVFETLSCGVPLITNFVPHLSSLFPPDAPFLRTYKNSSDLLPVCAEALADVSFVSSGDEAANFIRRSCTYEHRLREAFDILGIE